ncbi:hypothetical protein [Sphingomonas sp. S-NIH.Pt15_0812]|uniref:hypothetical protein n=1 Tax=Sphingomonas sp. S-NIH.Pt15_0812 TaxID=1920129 RepID=UPI000F7D5DEF|nr:hypothetical protein [Sphingomonas sp. S-NIH.Pt15_0812]RSU47543.1 hypothetical protein BRX43_14000 [Sphingomonas sp. S-NIH.Pt15_0812]
MAHDHTRRTLLGGAGLIGVGIIAPLSAMPPANRHHSWLKERASLLAYANSLDSDSPAMDAACDGLARLEKRILETPAANAAEARAKLRLPVALDGEGMMLTGNDAAALLIDIAPFLSLEG